MQIRRALDRYDMSDEGLRKVLSVLGRLVESQPALGDTLWVEALWRAQTYPELADLESWRVVIARLRDAASLSSQERSKLLGEMYILRQDPSLWSRYVGMADYFEASVRGTYLYVALHLDKRSRGQWAPSLEALVPHTISAVPLDPIAGAGYSYTVGTDSAVLESAVAIPEEPRRDRKQVVLTLGQQ